MICATKSQKNPSMNLTVTGNRVENVHEILRIACTKNESTKGTFMLNNAKKSIYWVFDPMYALILIEKCGFHRIFDDKI